MRLFWPHSVICSCVANRGANPAVAYGSAVNKDSGKQGQRSTRTAVNENSGEPGRAVRYLGRWRLSSTVWVVAMGLNGIAILRPSPWYSPPLGLAQRTALARTRWTLGW